ncbi:MAG TPA: hypothetical protein VI504_14135 [Candidatus Eisenbacteria bacterium]|jgi:hypothetical protein
MSGRSRESQSGLPRPDRVRIIGIVFAFVALIGLRSTAARAQALDGNLWVTDGDVNTIVPWGNTLYIGGTFGYVGPNTGGWTDLDINGHATSRLPRLDGDVTTTVSDGAGGWFLGGSFTHVAGIARPGLAHVLADGSLSPWTPNPATAYPVTCLEHQGTRLFVVTDFGELLAYDDATGNSIADWTPQVFGQVSSLAVNGTTLFAAGDVSFNVTGSSQVGTGIAAVNTSTGAIEAWDPAPDAPVTRIRIVGRWLYATGGFTDIGGQAHSGLARTLLATKAFDANWNPSVDAPVNGFATVGSGLWIGGGFFLVNGELRNRIAVLDTTTGASLALTPDISSIDGDVSAMTIRGSFAYLGISPPFAVQLGGAAKPLVVRVVTSTGALDPAWRVLGVAAPTGEVAAVATLSVSATGAVLAGRLVSAGGQRQVAVAALDRTTGIPRSWDPGLAVDEAFPIVPSVAAILPTNHAVYLGGYFTHAGGQLRKSLAAIDSASGKAQAWHPDLGPTLSTAAGSAASLALYQDKLLVGGLYSSISGVSHVNLAQVDTLAGTPVAGWTCNVPGSVNCLLVQGTTVFVGGGLSDAGGQPRANIAAVNGSTGAVLAWNPGVAGNAVQSLAARSDTLYIGGDYSQVSGQNRTCLAAVSASTGSLLGWAPAAFGPARALVIDGPNLLVGGEFSFIAGQPTAFLGRVGRFSGTLVTGMPVADAEVFALAGDASSLYVGGRFGRLAGSPTANVGHVGGPDLAGPAVSVVAANGGEYLTIATTYRFEYTASDPSGVASVDLELSRTGSGGPWALLAAGVRNTGHYEWLVSGPAVVSGAWLRVTAHDFAGNAGNDLSNLAFSIGAGIASVDPGTGRGGLVSFALGPNPARLRTDLRFSLRQTLRARFRLVDVQGREVWASPEQSYAPGEHLLSCGLQSLAPGLYFMRFELGRESRTARLVVVR